MRDSTDVEDQAADVLEQAVDALRRRRVQRRRQRLEVAVLLVVDAGVEAEFVDDVGALVGAAGHADGAAAARPCASWPTTPPTAPLAASTTMVSPALGSMMWISPTQAVTPGMPTAPR